MYSIKATDKNIKQLVKEGIEKYGPTGDFNYIDTSAVTDMSFLFFNIDFNGDISLWDTHNVMSMYCMFYKSSFNSDISGWDVHNVMDMTSMFEHSAFNGDISLWDVSHVEYVFPKTKRPKVGCALKDLKKRLLFSNKSF